MVNKKYRIVMGTDIPFWNAKTGAEQRMLSLVNYFSRAPFEITTFYVGSVTPDDHRLILAHQLSVVFFESEKPPAEFLARIKWYAEATTHQIQKWMTKSKTASNGLDSTSAEPPSPLKLSDYRWPWAIDQFRRLIDRFRPHVFIAQYVTMAYLLEGLSVKDRRDILCVLDTHDILHERGLQFDAAGYLHWLDINRETEKKVWQQFDTVIAIQDIEADIIRELAKTPQVLVVGHAPRMNKRLAHVKPDTRSNDDIRIGYIGSANYSNWHALNRFLIEAWPELHADFPTVELFIAGKICQWFDLMDPSRKANLISSGVLMMGEVETLDQFYESVDIVINPVQFGTGLKIKNVEALAFGKPLVTTTSGASGMTQETQNCCCIVDSLAEMGSELVRLCADSDSRQRLSREALIVANQELSENAIYSELAQHFANSNKTEFQKLPIR